MANGAERRVARTREIILAAAEQLFPEKGFLGTSMDDVAATASVSKQTVYAHFGSKEALFVAVVEGMTGAAVDEHRSRIERRSELLPIADYLYGFAVEQLSIVMTPALLRLRRLVIAEVDRFPELGAALHRNGPGRSIDRLAAAFSNYVARGQLRLGDARQAAGFFNWLVMGGPTNDAMFLGEAAIASRDHYEAHAHECVRIFLAAYGATQA